jgi:hypothetical protein
MKKRWERKLLSSGMSRYSDRLLETVWRNAGKHLRGYKLHIQKTITFIVTAVIASNLTKMGTYRKKN